MAGLEVGSGLTMAIRTEYEVWRDELAADQRRHTLARGLLELAKIAGFYTLLVGGVLLASHLFGGRA